jgi:hypothetical protein
VAQDGTPLAPEHLISSVNLGVEVRLLAIGKLEDLPLV